MVSYVVLWLAFVVKIARSDTVGNSLVTCTACQAVQAKDFACNVNCQVANGNNDEVVTNGVIAELLQQIKQLNDTVQAVDNRVNVVEQKLEAPRDAFTATSYNYSLQNTEAADITVGEMYKFTTEVLDQLDSYDPATGIFKTKQNGTYSLLLAARSHVSVRAILNLIVEKPNKELRLVCKANTYSQHEDSTCSTLYELQVGDKVHPKGANFNGKMNMGEKFGSFQAYFVF